jgi:hemoglobin-like flavoprotein
MMVTETQKILVQQSFALIMPIADDAAALFYRRLFELDPSLERMFKGDMAEQRRKLMQMLTAISAAGTRVMAWPMSITTPSARRCSGR